MRKRTNCVAICQPVMQVETVTPKVPAKERFKTSFDNRKQAILSLPSHEDIRVKTIQLVANGVKVAQRVKQSYVSSQDIANAEKRVLGCNKSFTLKNKRKKRSTKVIDDKGNVRTGWGIDPKQLTKLASHFR